MPIYEFECPRCAHRFEELLRSSDAKVPACPGCGCKRPQRLMSAFQMGGNARSGGSESSCAGCSSDSCAHCSH